MRSRDVRHASERSRRRASSWWWRLSSRSITSGSRHNKRWDLTAAKQFSLSDQTRKVLADLKEPVHVKVFALSNEFERFRDRLDEYTYAGKQLSVDYIDPEKKPAIAQQYGITASGTVVFEYKGRSEKATSDGEQDLTNALIKVIQGRQPKIYFVQGHGEKDTVSADRSGYNGINGALTSSNFVTDKLVLAQQGAVPADADIVIVAGPKTDFLQPEIEFLRAYLARGGKVLLMLDPVLKADQPQLTLLQGLAKDWGIDVGNDMVLDVSGMGQLIGTDESVPVAATYPPHPITDNFRLLTAYPLTRSVSADRRRRERPHRTVDCRNQPAELGGDESQESDERPAGEAGRRRQGRTRVAGGCRVGTCRGAREETGSEAGSEAGRSERAQTGITTGRRSATPTSRATPRSASRAIAISF